MSLPFFLQLVPARVPPSPSHLPQKLVGLPYFFYLLKLHLCDNSPCFKMRIEIAGPRSLEGFLPIFYALPCSVLTLPSLIQFLGKLCGPPCSFFFCSNCEFDPHCNTSWSYPCCLMWHQPHPWHQHANSPPGARGWHQAELPSSANKCKHLQLIPKEHTVIGNRLCSVLFSFSAFLPEDYSGVNSSVLAL